MVRRIWRKEREEGKKEPANLTGCPGSKPRTAEKTKSRRLGKGEQGRRKKDNGRRIGEQL